MKTSELATDPVNTITMDFKNPKDRTIYHLFVNNKYMGRYVGAATIPVNEPVGSIFVGYEIPWENGIRWTDMHSNDVDFEALPKDIQAACLLLNLK